MGAIGKLSLTLVLLGAVYIYVKVNKEMPVPTIEEKWWGPGKALKEDAAIRPFKINVSEKVIKDLQNRLRNTLPFHPPLEDVNHNYGINTNLLKTIVDYWKNKYNWQQRQEFLNQFPQFKTSIQGLKIHFIHAKPKNVPQGVQVLPLLLLHGWPGSVREFYEMIPILTTPQKGDVGSAIAQAMAVLYPDNILAVHRNMCFTSKAFFHPKVLLGTIFPSLFFTKKEIEKTYPLSNQFSFLILESGYFHLQATKPDTIGVSLRDSPVGLAAYILEKFITWTDPSFKDLSDGGLTKKFTLDQLLDNVMIYWVTNSITTSVRVYAEANTYKYRNLEFDNIPVKIPAGCNRFNNEIAYSAETLLREQNTNLIHLTDFEDGGHFAAFELPQVLAKDLFEFVEKVRNLPKEAKEL